MPKHAVAANKNAIRALRCPEGRQRVVYQLNGHGNEGLKLFVENTGAICCRERSNAFGRLKASV